MVTRHRAVSGDQKRARRQVIVDAAWGLFQHTDYRDIAMAQVAERAGLAKGTLYLYFKTKEELFLAVYQQQLDGWFDEVDAHLQQADVLHAAGEAAVLICTSLDARPAMTRLLAILHGLLEQNIEYAAAVAFKRHLLVRLQRTGALLERWMPWVPAGQGTALLLRIYALAIGLGQLADPAPIMREVMQREPDLRAYQVDFSQEFAQVLGAFLNGLEHSARRMQP